MDDGKLVSRTDNMPRIYVNKHSTPQPQPTKKPNMPAPPDRRWLPGWYKIERVGGAAAALGPGDMDWWYCEVYDCPGGWGAARLESHDWGDRPFGYLGGTGSRANVPCQWGEKLPGSGERYLNKISASPHFKVTPVKITKAMLKKWDRDRTKAWGPNGPGAYGRVDAGT